VVQAYDRSGNVSAPSPEVAGVAPSSSSLTISCPAPVVTSPNGGPVSVTFSPSASGGTAPVTTGCWLPSWSIFSVGSTPIVCTATDAVGAVATCDTAVVVLPPQPAPSAPPSGPRPDAPSGLVSTVNGATVILQWVAPTAYLAASYVIEAGSAPGLADQASLDTGNLLRSFTASPVPSGIYYVRIRARSLNGALSPPSNELAITVGQQAASCAATLPPSGLSAAVNGGTVTLNWQGSSGGSYVIEAGSIPGASDLAAFDTQSPATSFTAFGVGAGTYFVRLRATNTCGARSAPSNEVVVNVGQ
jgi:hypothetical protein